MAAPLERSVEELSEEYARARARAVGAIQQARDTTGTATSARGHVTVVVGAGGAVYNITFNTREYRRMAPAELASMLTDTIRRAQESLHRQLAEVMPSATPGEVPMMDVLAGRVDWARLLPERLDVDGLPPHPRAAG